MSALESPLEALDFNYLSYSFITAVNSLWAWIAVVTAAVSFWRIISKLPLPESKPEPLCQDRASTSPIPPVDVGKPAGIPSPGETEHSSPASQTTPFYVSDRKSSTTVKFSLYYKDGYQIEGDNICEDDDLGGVTAVSENARWYCDDLGKTMRIRMGDLGWYRCLDLTALDGSVVRLWDGNSQGYDAASASLLYGGAAVVW